MSRPLTFAVMAAFAGLVAGQPALAAAPVQAARPAAARLSIDSVMHELYANPRTRAVMNKHFPNLTHNPHYFMLEGMTVRQMAPISGGKLTAAELAKIEAELQKAQ